MTPQRWRKVSELFAKTMELSVEERHKVLASADVDPTIRAEVEELLVFHEQPSRGSTTPDLATDFSSLHNEHLQPFESGTRIGQFTLQRFIGRGASGMVYEAMQDAPSRIVALKVLPFAFAHTSGFHRFSDEVAALARMQHPGIAQIIESGTGQVGSTQTAFVAMEAVPNAQPMVQACASLPLRDRVRLFTHVCDALHHAHMRGVIHRDIKPANILIDASAVEKWANTHHTRRGTESSTKTSDVVIEPKLIDFGVARLLDHSMRASERTLPGAVVGTLQYMSPEQALGDVESIDVRTDVYALGVVLYRFVSGTMPYEVPSNPAAAANVIANTPATPLSRHRSELGGDLETIVMTALAKRSDQRYQSAAALADDLRRWLEHKPIFAKTPSYAKRISLWAIRNPAISAITACLVLSVCIGSVLVALKMREAKEQREVSESVSAFVTAMLQSPRVSEKGKEVRVVDILEDAERSLTTLSDKPRAKEEAQHVLAQTYAVLGDYEKAAGLQQERLASISRTFGANDLRTIDATAELAEATFDLGELERAEQLSREVLAARISLLGSDALTVAKAHNDLAVVLIDTGKSDEAEDHLRKSLAIRRGHNSIDIDFSHSLVNLGVLRRRALDHKEASKLFEEAVAIQERVGEPAHVDLADTRRFFALSLMDLGELDRAQAIIEDVLASLQSTLGEKHISTAGAYVALARVRQRAGDVEGAETNFQRAVGIYETVLGTSHPYTQAVLKELDQMKHGSK